MAGKGAVLASRILNEISSLGVVVARVEDAWKAAAASNDELYFDSVALLNRFYIDTRSALYSTLLLLDNLRSGEYYTYKTRGRWGYAKETDNHCGRTGL